MRAAILALTFIAVAGCGKKLGTRCTETAECGVGLPCIELSTCGTAPNCGSLADGWKVCSQPCTTDADCAGLSEKPVCSLIGEPPGRCLDSGGGAAAGVGANPL